MLMIRLNMIEEKPQTPYLAWNQNPTFSEVNT